MLPPFVRDLCVTLAVLALMAGVYAGWGALVARMAGVALRPAGRFFIRIWLGWAASLLFFQLWNLLLPIDVIGSSVFALGGLVGLGLSPRTAVRESGLPPSRRAVAILATLVFVIAAGGRAMLEPMLYDTGLYHLSAIRWLNEYAIVPGLANLHGRLGFNQSYLIYAASLNFFPFARHAHHFASLFLVATLFAQSTSLALRSGSSMRSRAAGVLVSFATVALATRAALSSPSADDGMALLQLALLLTFLALLEEPDRELAFGDLAVIGILTTAAITVKLSSLGFALALLVIAAIHWSRRFAGNAVDLRRAVPGLVIAASLLIAWIGRSLVLSGCGIYPVSVTCFSFDWSVPLQKVELESRWIRSWARAPKQDWREVLGKSDWFAPWLARARGQEAIASALRMLLIAAPLAAIARWRDRGAPPLWPLILAPAAGLLWWFFTAPDPRFATGLFAWLAIAPAAQLVMLLDRHTTRAARWVLATIAAFALLRFLPFAAYTPLTGFRPTRARPVVAQTTRSGLRVLVPYRGDRVWDAPLPAAPAVDPNLRLRGESLQSGFTVRPAR